MASPAHQSPGSCRRSSTPRPVIVAWPGATCVHGHVTFNVHTMMLLFLSNDYPLGILRSCSSRAVLSLQKAYLAAVPTCPSQCCCRTAAPSPWGPCRWPQSPIAGAVSTRPSPGGCRSATPSPWGPRRRPLAPPVPGGPPPSLPWPTKTVSTMSTALMSGPASRRLRARAPHGGRSPPPGSFGKQPATAQG